MPRRKRDRAVENAACSPLWGLVLVLGEIADRVTRRLAEEHAVELQEPAPRGPAPREGRR